MQGKKAFAGGVFMIFLIILLGVALYLLYMSLPQDAKEYVFNEGYLDDDDLPEPNYASSKQFYDNMRFPDREISYKIESACDDKKTAEVEEVFSFLEEKTILEFYSSPAGQIQIFCSEVERPSDNEGYFVAGEGGPTEVINTTLFGAILSAKVSFFREEKCSEPKVALHEILHALGFDHNDNPNSILYPTLDCDQTLDESVVEDINNIYSVDGLADFKIADIEARKVGCGPRKCLNFKVEIINQGLKDASNSKLRVYTGETALKFDNGKDYYDLDEIDIGVRKTLTVENLNLGLFDSSEDVRFIVDAENEVLEIFEDNNQVSLRLSE